MSVRPPSLRALLLVSLVVTASCGVPSDVVATVGDHRVTATRFQVYLEQIVGEPWAAVDPRVASRMLDQYLDEAVVVTATRSATDPLHAAEPGRRSARLRSLLAEACGEAPPPEPAEVEAEVERRLDVTRPARARVRQMVLDDAETAAAASRRLAAGDAFDEVAAELGRQSQVMLEPGVVAQGTLPEALDEVIFNLPVGGRSEPVEGPAGYHVLEVLELIPAGPPDRDRARLEAVRQLEDRTRKRFLESCIERLADDAGVSVYSSHLWFDYRGRYGDAVHAS